MIGLLFPAWVWAVLLAFAAAWYCYGLGAAVGVIVVSVVLLIPMAKG